MKKVSCWKKVYEKDLQYICDELTEIVTTPACIIFTGEVGAGKTTFIQHLMKNDRPNDEVMSPTYSLIHEYGDCAHADFYRIEDIEEIIHLEMGLYAESKKYFLIEWGIDYLNEIKLQLGSDYKFYELIISTVDSQEDGQGPREISLLQLDNIDQ